MQTEQQSGAMAGTWGSEVFEREPLLEVVPQYKPDIGEWIGYLHYTSDHQEPVYDTVSLHNSTQNGQWYL